MSGGDGVIIRRYRPADAEGLAAVFRDSVRHVANADYSAAQLAAWAPDDIDAAAWAARHAGQSCWVGELDGVLAGFIDLGADGLIDMLYVDAAHQRRGVATALFRAAEAAAIAADRARLYTDASITGLSFFLRMGFRVIREQAVQRGGETLTNYRMEKTLRIQTFSIPT